ncbi:hypothetical protein E2E30_18420 [Sphingomonas sp. AAP5]|uniref:S8 family serine peptidase n=1 Tax=Sphingomonas sp. AAP5 TaxID=1523415 RepID=UPI0010572D9C|nr:S8 family serine peptidase [Sphingomonas sp. AAP5]QBM77528.1 hypothetical protein E2E30_18420 [Sphingomonas sp. AAP5]
MPKRLVLLAAILPLGLAAAQAQLLPQVPVVGALPRIEGLADSALRLPAAAIDRLDDVRRATIDRLVRQHPREIARDPDGFAARAGEIVVDAPSDAWLAAAQAKGYRLLERGDILGVGFARLAVPANRSLKAAIGDLRQLGDAEVSADQLHFASGIAPVAAAAAARGAGPLVGVIDGGVAGAALSSGFATGAPRANDHATAVASLIAGSGIAGSGSVRGALPGARIASADVYGADPAGGNATAIAKALGWMVAQRVAVVTISLVGPDNPLLGRVVAAAQARGLMIVAAVGNDGPAAPPSYPASYPGVIAVTGVDARNRVLIEAGRARHLDYAAPGADLRAAATGGRSMTVRGTSFAAPLVAATIARVYPALDPTAMPAALAQVDAGAVDLGARGPDAKYGRGLVCGTCRTPPAK